MADQASPSRREVLSMIRTHLAARGIPAASVQESTRYVRDLAVDSLDLQTLARDLEDTFELMITPEDAIELQSVRDTIDFVTLKVRATR